MAIPGTVHDGEDISSRNTSSGMFLILRLSIAGVITDNSSRRVSSSILAVSGRGGFHRREFFLDISSRNTSSGMFLILRLSIAGVIPA